MQVSFAYDLVFRTMNKFLHTWRKQLRRVKLVNKVLVTQVLLFFAHEFLCQILKNWTEIVIAHLLDLEDGLLRKLSIESIEMPSFDCLEDVYIIFIQQMRYKNSHKQRLHK